MKITRIAGLGTMCLFAMFAVGEASAAVSKPPKHDNCKKWELIGPAKANWVGAPKDKRWLCVSGVAKGATASASAVAGRATASAAGSTDGCVDCNSGPTPPGNSAAHRKDFKSNRSMDNNGWAGNRNNNNGSLNGNRDGNSDPF